MVSWRVRVLVLLLLPALAAALAACGGIAVLETEAHGSSSTGTAADPTLGCAPHRADCNGVASDGCEIDLASDAESCGTCGHGCQGGHCQSSLCQPVIVAAGQGYAYRLAATETSLYWTREDGSVLRAEVGGQPEILASGQNAPGDIAIDATHVYWANLGDETIMRAPLHGGAAEIVVSGAGQPWSLAVSATMLSFTDNKTGDVRAISLAGGSELFTIATTPGAWGIAMDAKQVYWTTFAFGSVFAAPLGGGATTMLVSDFSSPADLALAGDRLVFGTVSGAGVHAVPLGGGPTIALTQEGGFGVAADDHHVYFGMYDGRLARVPLGGGEPEIMGIGPATPTDIALTAKIVYWTAAASDGLILGVAK